MHNFIRKSTCLAVGLASLIGMTTVSLPTDALSADYTQGSCPSPEFLKQPDAFTNPEDWFPHSQTPPPNNVGFDSSTICNFHLWSWNAFLWLTQNEDGKPRFLNWETPYDVLGIDNREVLTPRMGKSPHAETLDEYLQAGTDGILIDQSGKPVYYSQHLSPEFIEFIKQWDLTDPLKVQKLDPELNWSIGSLELKASWKILGDKDNPNDFYTMESQVYGLKNKGGQIAIDTDNIQQETLALVGFHIGGIVKGHPEMIWATFEHEKNAPVVPENATPDTIVSDQDHTFYAANTKYKDCNVNMVSTPDLVLDEANQTLSPSTQVCLQYEFGNGGDVPVTPNTALPQAEQDKINQSVLNNIQTNDSNVADLNRFVHQNMDQTPNSPENPAYWNNYRLVGAIWFKPTDALRPGMTLESDFYMGDAFETISGDRVETGQQFLIGSMKLSNSTIETFTQRQSAMNNCFRCHNSTQRFPPAAKMDPLPELNLNISHAFMNIYFWSQELSKK